MSNKKYKPTVCTQCEAMTIVAQKVIDDWHATCEMGITVSSEGKIKWASLYQLESLLPRPRKCI
jgi:hypothetical protein